MRDSNAPGHGTLFILYARELLSESGSGRLRAGMPLADSVVADFWQRRVARMSRFFVGIVAAGVIAADERPARVVGRVHVAAMQKIRVKKQGIAGLAFDIDELHLL